MFTPLGEGIMSSASTTVNTPTIEVCHGPQCSDSGGRALAAELEEMGLKVCAGDCRSQCAHAPLVLVDNYMISKATTDKVVERLKTLQA
ncbi:hypothetical protein AL013_05365 [Mariprofundus ferrooxydans]|uniref:Uncharacterized protein n=2 Tax=Mariprofundus ferrooxydans TaxID=314344 RepID=Q0F1Z6_9PROT|nr:hypothetical protein SPV1_02362 [Mariprofundus ferrooxydans PV-1]KON47989.1 hypothetical protein AL013_05365 [Mariprofundus ferrooxydans]